MTLTYTIQVGPYAGRSTTDIEQHIRWLGSITRMTPEFAQALRDVVAEVEANSAVDRVIDKAAAKFEDRE